MRFFSQKYWRKLMNITPKQIEPQQIYPIDRLKEKDSPLRCGEETNNKEVDLSTGILLNKIYFVYQSSQK